MPDMPMMTNLLISRTSLNFGSQAGPLASTWRGHFTEVDSGRGCLFGASLFFHKGPIYKSKRRFLLAAFALCHFVPSTLSYGNSFFWLPRLHYDLKVGTFFLQQGLHIWDWGRLKSTQDLRMIFIIRQRDTPFDRGSSRYRVLRSLYFFFFGSCFHPSLRSL